MQFGILTMWWSQGSLPSCQAVASKKAGEKILQSPFKYLTLEWHHFAICYQPKQSQTISNSRRDKQLLPLNGRNVKEFMSVFNLPQKLSRSSTNVELYPTVWHSQQSSFGFLFPIMISQKQNLHPKFLLTSICHACKTLYGGLLRC